MKKILILLCLVSGCAAGRAATVTVGAWTPIFKGIELATGQQTATLAGEVNHRVFCFRVDLADPDVQLLTTPHCTNCSLETLSESTSHFLEQYGLQVAVNGGFYGSSSGPGDTALGTPDDVYGLLISRGAVVSPNQTTCPAVMLFTTNKQAFYIPNNSPATNTAGIYTAVAGNYALLINGVNQRAATPNDLDPRTALGLSADRRYLFLQAIDGRQTGWSDGADFHDAGEWLKRFGAADAINLDGGGSTTMVQADCQGKGFRLNRSSFVAAYGRERNIGQNFGVAAKPLPSDLKNLDVQASGTTALLTWHTELAGTTQVEYGLTTNYGTATPLDTRLLHNHVVTLTGLTSGTNYYFRAISTVGGVPLVQACGFATFTSLITTQVFGLTKIWRYTTNNLNGVAWTARTYNDTNWIGQGPGLLSVENNAAVQPRNTTLPPTYGQTIASTYYFRTHFTFTGSTTGAALVFSNYVDDGAVFYLNGTEVYRLRMAAAPTAITYTTAATGVPCTGTPQSGDALTTCPDRFTVSGNLLTNLVQGDNVLAVEVHNYGSLVDVTFGSALILNQPAASAPVLNVWREGHQATLFWNGEGFTLQQVPALGLAGGWSNAPGPVTQSPVLVTNAATMFYRLRK